MGAFFGPVGAKAQVERRFCPAGTTGADVRRAGPAPGQKEVRGGRGTTVISASRNRSNTRFSRP